jgi:hypothetical protein
MELEQNSAAAASEPPQASAPPPPAPNPAPAAEGAAANTFKAQIEQAKKDWENIGKPKAEETDAEPDKGKSAKPEAKEGSMKKLLEIKDAAISKAKRQTESILEKLKILESEHGKAVADKNESAAAMALGKAELLSQELEESIGRENSEAFFGEAAAEGTIADMDAFREHCMYYIPDMSANKDISRFIGQSKYPYATIELLLREMADKCWSAKKLAEMPTPSLGALLKAVGREAAGRIDGKGKEAPPAHTHTVPASVVATAGGDNGAEPALDTGKASMKDIIMHVRKYGGKGIAL